jgi:hypothetical protein
MEDYASALHSLQEMTETKRAAAGPGFDIEELVNVKSSIKTLKDGEDKIGKTLDNFALIIACVVENIELNTLA